MFATAYSVLVIVSVVSSGYIGNFASGGGNPLVGRGATSHANSALQSFGGGIYKPEKDYNAYPKYNFNYEVNDGQTGDIKSQQEERDGKNVVGSYTVAEPDGTLRNVQYTADENGFNAVVSRIGTANHPSDYKQTSPIGGGDDGSQKAGNKYSAWY